MTQMRRFVLVGVIAAAAACGKGKAADNPPAPAPAPAPATPPPAPTLDAAPPAPDAALAPDHMAEIQTLFDAGKFVDAMNACKAIDTGTDPTPMSPELADLCALTSCRARFMSVARHFLRPDSPRTKEIKSACVAAGVGLD